MEGVSVYYLSVIIRPIVISLFALYSQQTNLFSCLRSISRNNVNVTIYMVKDNNSCINEYKDSIIICNQSDHVIYPINRLRNLGLKTISGFVIDVDADIIPQSNPYIKIIK